MEVIQVIDGDTVKLEDGQTVRYLLVDTPEIARNANETSECFAEQAKAFNEQLVLGRCVRIELDEEEKDLYQRTLAYVYLGETMINEVLVERGYGEVLVIPPNQRYAERLEEVEEQARAARAGLWGHCQ